MKILAKIYSRELQQTLDPMKNVITTIGAYEAMYAAFQGLVNPGDEVSGKLIIKMNTSIHMGGSRNFETGVLSLSLVFKGVPRCVFF